MAYVAMGEKLHKEKVEVADYTQMVDNTIDHQSRLTTIESGGSSVTNLAIGTIIFYWGNLIALPGGWHVCDGSNGTPNLDAKFLIGAGDLYAIGDSGGILEHTHSVGSTVSGGSHSHSLGSFTTGGESSKGGAIFAGTTGVTGSHSHYSTGAGSGSSSSHSHAVNDLDEEDGRPPFTALYLIMRIS